MTDSSWSEVKGNAVKSRPQFLNRKAAISVSFKYQNYVMCGSTETHVLVNQLSVNSTKLFLHRQCEGVLETVLECAWTSVDSVLMAKNSEFILEKRDSSGLLT